MEVDRSQPTPELMFCHISAMVTAKHDTRSSSSMRRCGTAGNEDDQKRMAIQAKMHGWLPFDRHHNNPSQQVVNSKQARVLMVSAHACCFTMMVPI